MNLVKVSLFGQGLSCTICKAEACDCWEKCSCGWTTLRGYQCGSPTKKCSSKLNYKRGWTHDDKPKH